MRVIAAPPPSLPDGGQSSGRQDEALLTEAADHGPIAMLWQPPQCLVVPRSYERHASFDKARAQSAQRGWPVFTRHSGGGIVPQGDGILNLSLCYPHEGKPLEHTEAAYHLICEIIQQSLAPFGIVASAQAVAGSFCDGRFNLAALHEDSVKKIAGTAQLWRRVSTVDRPERTQVVLLHAVLLVHVDCAELTQCINAFEGDLASGVQYRADRIVSLHQLLESPASLPHWQQELHATLEAQLRATRP